MKVKVIKAANSGLLGLTYDLGQPIHILSDRNTIYQDMAIGFTMCRVQVYREGNRVDLSLTPIDEKKRPFVLDVKIVGPDKPEISLAEWSDIRRALITTMKVSDETGNRNDIALANRLEAIDKKIDL